MDVRGGVISPYPACHDGFLFVSVALGWSLRSDMFGYG